VEGNWVNQNNFVFVPVHQQKGRMATCIINATMLDITLARSAMKISSLFGSMVGALLLMFEPIKFDWFWQCILCIVGMQYAMYASCCRGVFPVFGSRCYFVNISLQHVYSQKIQHSKITDAC
jgi:hypothetical protein